VSTRDDESERISPEPVGAVITGSLVDTTLTSDDIAPIRSSVEAAKLRAVVGDVLHPTSRARRPDRYPIAIYSIAATREV